MARSSGGTSRSSASEFVLKHRRIWRRREKWLPDLSRITTTRDTTPASGISHLLINCVVEHRLLLKNENASWRRQNACVPNSEASNPLPICSLTTTLKIPLYFEPLHYKLGEQNLLKLGLLQRKYDNVKRGEYPPFDAQAGGFKSRIDISYLGRMLLKEAGIDLPY